MANILYIHPMYSLPEVYHNNGAYFSFETYPGSWQVHGSFSYALFLMIHGVLLLALKHILCHFTITFTVFFWRLSVSLPFPESQLVGKPMLELVVTTHLCMYRIRSNILLLFVCAGERGSLRICICLLCDFLSYFVRLFILWEFSFCENFERLFILWEFSGFRFFFWRV